ARGVVAIAGLRIRVAGAAPERGGPYVIVANHASLLDVPVLAAVIPIRFHFASRPHYFRVPFLGWGMRAAGTVKLDPERPRDAAGALASFAARFRRGACLLLFPEGSRTPDGRLGRYKRGAFLAAIDHRVAVLPVALSGLFRAMPRGSRRVRPGEVTVTIGSPIPTGELAAGDARDLASRAESWTRTALTASP
ncbi:MAG: lysophospholipid acyltransferase family protein, partial [Planctomycetota bacterium]